MAEQQPVNSNYQRVKTQLQNLCARWHYTKAEINNLLSSKSDNGHKHDGWVTKVNTSTCQFYVNEALRLCELHYKKSITFTSSYSSFQNLETISQVTSYAPKTTLYAQAGDFNSVSRLNASGQIGVKSSRTAGTYAIDCNFMWHY